MTPDTKSEGMTNDGPSSSDAMRGGAGRPYLAPKLERYGDMRFITRAVGKNGNSDGGGAKADNKTRA